MQHQHRPVRDCSHTSPPIRPLTPPRTAERGAADAAAAAAAAALPDLVATIKERQAGTDPASWVQLSVPRDTYTLHRRRIEELVRRSDYDPNRGLLTLRMPSLVHEFFAGLLVRDLVRKLDAIAAEDSSAGVFASQIQSGGSATIRLASGDDDSFRPIHRDPDAQFRHKDARYPGVVVEVAFSRDGKDLRRLAQDYILYSDGDIKAVVGVSIGYANSQPTVSLWRPKFTRTEDDCV